MHYKQKSVSFTKYFRKKSENSSTSNSKSILCLLTICQNSMMDLNEGIMGRPNMCLVAGSYFLAK
jgi:hypothetical protein